MNDASADKTLPAEQIAAEEKKKKEEKIAKNNKIWWHRVNKIAAVFWVFLLIKLFVFDFDVYLVSLINPDYLWILDHKLWMLAAIVLVFMVALRSVSPLFALVVIYLYPLIFLFWQFPKFIWKQHNWLLGFAVLNTGVNFSRSFRRSLISAGVFLLSTILILAIDNQYVMYGAAAAIFVVTALAYVFAFLKAPYPAATFESYAEKLPLLKADIFLSPEAASIRALPDEEMTKEQLATRNEEMQNVLLYNRACLLISKKLRGYRDSGANIASYLLNFATLLVFTILSFALINEALYKADHALYRFTTGSDSFASFFRYSAGSLVYLSYGLVPSAPLSQGVHLVELVFGVLLVAILATTIFFLRSDKYMAQLENVIVTLQQKGQAAEETISRDFRQPSLEVATEALAKSEKTMPGFVRHLTKEIERQ
jgi:hypothetical protein